MTKFEHLYESIQEKDKDKAEYYLKNYSAIPFVKSIMKQLKSKGTLTEKQMEALNKVYKRYNKKSD